ncbi:65c995ef-687c-43fa-8e78-e24562eec5c7 [Thermothielavioides terrestris]|uniref:65c995ef-687c-43fa-8e78-e24562eec5c7 n=1 Tax=Thermothielavioides terrestris TaxID=2587410 RepID=A0A446BTP7_9PEZI|nr:65c995ef-687c-43fa-8e78-e24562eec5c7 [Thermothielavioides terrestris]
MAAATPSALFQRLANAWRLLALRSDVDDIVLELLGRFSLERIYASASDRVAYQHLVIALLSQLKTIFDIQRLTIPSENAPLGRHLGFLVSWEVGLRSVEFVLQTIAEGRESLWEHRKLRDKYLAEFLLSALRVLSVHPKTPSNQRARDRRERFARIHGALEQVFDSYPGPKSFSLEVCKEVAAQLHADPDVLMLPPKLRSELPNLASELYPLPPCLQPPSIAELAPPGGFGNWLAQLLALRDVAQFVLAASVQYAANGETRDVRLQAASAKARNAVLTALDNLRTPPGTSKVDMVAIFSTTFRTILPDTIDLSSRDVSEPPVDECELDALDALCTRLRERQVTHRVSDREAAHSISQVIENILAQDDPGGRHTPARPGLYKAPTGASGDSSSLSSSALEAQKLEEISLSALLSTPKTHARGKPSKNINVCLSQNSTLALFWTQLLIHVLDVSTSPPTMLRIVNLMQTTTTASVMEYRIPSPLWCKSMAIDKQENYVVVGFEDATVRFFNVRCMEQPREDRLHAATRHGCRTCPPVDTLAFSSDGLVLLASMRSPKTGWIQTYSWRFPFHTFQELTACRYQVPLHESEDNGVSAAIFRPGTHGEEDLVCITTWTQSGTPVLIQPHDGHRAEIRTELSGRHSKLGNRVQCAAFSPSGRELVLVNDKGHVFQVSNLNSSPMDVRRIANTKELTAKSDSFAMSFMTWSDEEHVVLAWADSSRAVGWVRKIPMMSRVC